MCSANLMAKCNFRKFRRMKGVILRKCSQHRFCCTRNIRKIFLFDFQPSVLSGAHLCKASIWLLNYSSCSSKTGYKNCPCTPAPSIKLCFWSVVCGFQIFLSCLSFIKLANFYDPPKVYFSIMLILNFLTNFI